MPRAERCTHSRAGMYRVWFSLKAGIVPIMGDDKGETDVAHDPNVATSRDTGGIADEQQVDQASTTGTTPTPEYVGRIAGDDVGYAEETGAERRAQADKDGPDVSEAPTADPTRPSNPA
jgi:hypothetical protein